MSKWRKRFAELRLDGLIDEPRPGAARTIRDDVVEQIVIDTLESAPKDATHWSTRSMAERHGISRQTVSEIWRAFGLKPWEIDEFKISPDPQLVAKIRDIVGLYMNPPVNAAVFAVDEKPQIQALNRTAPMLPMMPTTNQRRSHDYQRNGTIDLFAALDIATGTVITDLRPNHTSGQFIKFLNKINREVPDHLDVHVVLDNLSTHKTPAVHKWLLRPRRFHFHFTPTYGFLINLVERWFSALTTKKLQRSAHDSVDALAADIIEWVETWNDNPRPFVWHKTADEILERLGATAPTSPTPTSLTDQPDRTLGSAEEMDHVDRTPTTAVSDAAATPEHRSIAVGGPAITFSSSQKLSTTCSFFADDDRLVVDTPCT